MKKARLLVQSTIQNKAVFLLLVVIVGLLLYIVFKADIDHYYFKKQVLKEASILHIPAVFNRCINYSSKPDEDGLYSDFNMDTCKVALNEYKSVEERFKNLIKSKKNISCGDFLSRSEASEFFKFVGGEIFDSAFRNGLDGLSLKRCVVDPYGLDTDHDCQACEDYETEIDRQEEAEIQKQIYEDALKRKGIFNR